MMRRAQRAEVAAQAVRAVSDPCYFAREILGVDLWAVQEEILRAAFMHRDTAVKSCHASGKTFVSAVVALAWVALHRAGEALAIVTSSDWRQVETQIFPEIHRMCARSKWHFGKDIQQTKVVLPGGNYIMGISTNNPIAFHGFHAKYILVIRDESSGIDPVILNSMQGMRAGGRVSFLDLMNPVMAAGPSVDLFDDPKVYKITIDGLETPNLAGLHIYETAEANEQDEDKAHNVLFLDEDALDENPRPELITRRFIREMYESELRIHGSLKPESDWWPKVRGMFPLASDAMLIQRPWVTAAHSRVVEPMDYEVCGLDVAGPGEDETAACLRSGMKVVKEMAWQDDTPEEKFCAWVGPPRDSLWINIDRQGIGWGLYTNLRARGYQIVGLNAGDAAWDRARFKNAKAEMYWNVRARLQDGEIGGPIDPKTQAQLVNIMWNQDNEKRLIDIESKKEARKRGVKSPDRAEAFILAFAATPIRAEARDWRYATTMVNGQDRRRNGWKWKSAMREARRRAGLVA